MKTMSKKCLYCYRSLDDETRDYHEACSLDFFGTRIPPIFSHTIEEMAELARNVVERSVAVPGVQPKLSLSLVKSAMENGNKETRLTVVGMLGGNYIFKPPSDIYPQMPENEHLTMRMAEAYGIPVVKSSLIRMESGELGYITKRIDRTEKGEKIHMIDMFQITEAFDKYKSSMERVGKALHANSDRVMLDVTYFFDLVLFSFLTGNNDMHLKNFSMITSGQKWSLAPAYDLLNVTIVNPDDIEEMALTIGARKRKLTHSNFWELGEKLMLNEKQLITAFGRISAFKPEAERLISESFLNAEFKSLYLELLYQRHERLVKP